MPKLTGYASLDALPEKTLTDKISGRIVSGEREMVVWWKMKAGAHVTAHSHEHEQIAWMVKGRMEFRLGDEKRICGPGDVVVIPGGVEHEAFFTEDTEVVDIFSPPREDFLAEGTPDYMKRD